MDDEEKGCDQGTDFSLECVKTLLMEVKQRPITLTDPLPRKTSTDMFKQLPHNYFGVDNNVFLHVDYHRKIRVYSDTTHDSGDWFLRDTMRDGYTCY